MELVLRYPYGGCDDTAIDSQCISNRLRTPEKPVIQAMFLLQEAKLANWDSHSVKSEQTVSLFFCLEICISAPQTNLTPLV